MNSPLVVRFGLLAIIIWAAVWAMLHQRRARSRNADGPSHSQSVRVENAAALAASLSATCGFVLLLTDSDRLHWLRTLSLAALIAFSATSITLSGYAGWIRASR